MNEVFAVKRAFTLVEVIISLLLIALFTSSLSFGFYHYYRQVERKKALERVEHLLLQADHLSTILQQEAKVLFLNKNTSWYAMLKPWGDEACEALDLFRNIPANFVELKGIKTIRLNDSELSELSLVFFPMKGIDLSYIEARDYMDYPLTAMELGITLTTHSDTPIMLSLESNEKNTTQTIDLRAFARITNHISIPQEYQDLDT